MPYCQSCGNELYSVDQFCTKCGETVSREPQGIKAESSRNFMGNYLALIILGALLLGTIILAAGVLGPVFFSMANLKNILIQFLFPATLALAVTVSAKKGPDLSVPYIAGLSAMIIALTAQTGSISLGVVVSIGICILFGAVNGTLIGLARIPPFIVTLATGLLTIPIMGIASGGETIMIEGANLLAPILLASAALVLVLVLIMIFDKGEAKNSWVRVLLIYAAGGLFASLAGYFWLMRIQAAVPRPGMGLEYVLFIYLSVTSIRWLKNSMFALLFSLVPAFVWALMSNAFSIVGMSIFVQTYAFIGIVVILAVVRFLLIGRNVSAR